MLTEPYTTIDNDRWYIRRDFDSKFYVVGKPDYEREDETGVPAYVGYQMEIRQPRTTADIERQYDLLAKLPFATKKFLEWFVFLAIRFLPENKDKL